MFHPEFQRKFNSSQFEGVVTDVWEKCEVDPHCCCAELAFDAPITVMFNVTLSSYNEYGAIGSRTVSWKSCYGIDELIKIISSKDTSRGVFGDERSPAALNEVIIDVDQDVSYLGSYMHSKI